MQRFLTMLGLASLVWCFCPSWARAEQPAQPSHAHVASETIVVGVETNYPPYSFEDSHGQVTGFNAELIRAMEHVVGLPLEIRIGPWTEVRQALRDGNTQAIAGMYSSPDRDKEFDFTPAFAVVQHAIFIRADSPEINTEDDLAGKTILVMQDDIMHDYLRRRGLGEQATTFPTIREVLRALADGRGDCALVGHLTGLHWIREDRLAGLRITGPFLAPQRYCIAVREGQEELLSVLSEGLAILRFNGRYQQIVDRWLAGEDHVAPLPHPRKEVRLGVLARRGEDWAHQTWGPTAEHLCHYISGYHFRVVPLAFEEVLPAAKQGEIDFILANPAMFVNLQKNCGASPLVTLRAQIDDEIASDQFGGLLIARAENTTVDSLRDVRGLEIAAVDADSLGGWLSVRWALHQAGVSVPEERVRFLGTHDAVVYRVLNGRSPLGVVRTGTLRHMASEGLIRQEDLRVIADRSEESGAGFPHTSKLFPEWPLARLPNTPDGLSERVTAVLLSMDRNSPAARAAHCDGWTAPKNYEIVHECLYDLRVAPYQNVGKISPWDVVRQYWPYLVGLLGGVLCILGIFAYVTYLNRHLRDTNEQLQRAIERANQATRAKSEFLAKMSHEIRTPLNGLLGMNYLLRQGDLTEQQREYADNVQVCGESLLVIINDILDVSKIEAGKLVLEEQPFDLREPVEEAVEIISRTAEDKDLMLNCYVDPRLTNRVIGDTNRLRQVLLNLLSNAVKFTEEGRVEIRAELLVQTKDYLRVRIVVRDTGIGIPKARQEALFEPFTQGDFQERHRQGGTGLGLAISKQLIEQMGGEISLDSEQGRGATFALSLHLPLDDGEAIGPDPAPLSGKRVLLVMGDTPQRDILRRYLSHWGCKAAVAEEDEAVRTALRHAEEVDQPFVAAILGQAFSGAAIGTVLRQLRAAGLAPHQWLRILSLRQRQTLSDQVDRAGKFILSPLKQNQVLQTLLDALRPAEAANGARDEADDQADASAEPATALQEIRVLIVEDNPVNQMLAESICEAAGHIVHTADNGQQAIDLLKTTDVDLVLMDCQMPGLDGFETTRRIRTGRAGVNNINVPVIALTAYAMKADRTRCLEAGMDDFLSKPFNPEELIETIGSWAGSRHQDSSSDSTDGKAFVR